MNFRKKIFKNKLTNLIQYDPQVTLEDVLLHEQLSITIKNESEILYNRILQKNEDNLLLNIFEYSLFDKQPPAKYQIYNTINQINKNASNFLENSGPKFIKFFKAESNDSGLLQPKELYKLLAYFIRNFTEKPEIYKNTTSAGFFQRFIENFLRYQVLDENEIIKFLKKC